MALIGSVVNQGSMQGQINEANGNLTGLISSAELIGGQVVGMRGLKGDKGGQGDPGADGQDGADGFSPIANVSKVGDTATITITDSLGTTTATVEDGADGQDGQDGADGHSPVITANKVGKVTTVYVDGTAIATINDGEDGSGSGTVTSVGIDAGDKIDVSGSPITSSGTITVSHERAGYLPTTGEPSLRPISIDEYGHIRAYGNSMVIPDELADLSDDSTHRLVSDTEKSTWNGKSDFSGDYDDLTNKPTLFSGDYDDLTNKPTLFSGNYNDLTNKPTIPTKISDLLNDLYEKGTTTAGSVTWTYRKWNDGTLEMWGEASTTLAINTASGSLYTTASTYDVAMPSFVASCDFITGELSGGGWVDITDMSNPPKVRFYAPTSYGSTTRYLRYYMKGTWT